MKLPAMEEVGELHLRLARTVRQLRSEHGWSQEEFAARCGLHRTYVGAIERGEYNVTINTLEKLAHALDVKPWDLLRGDDVLRQVGGTTSQSDS